MIKKILIISFCLFCAVESFAQAGPENANRYNNYIRTNGFRLGYDHNGDDEANRAFFLIEGQTDVDNGTTPCLFDTLTGAPLGGGTLVKTVYNTALGPAPHANTSSGTVKEVVHASSVSTTLMNVTMMGWDHGCGSSGDFHFDPSCDFYKEVACTNINTKEGPMGEYHTAWYTIEDSSQIRMQKVWKPTYGENFAETSNSIGPLTFGTIGSNEYRVHENGIRRRPAGAPLNLGYQNWWYNGIIGNDPVFTSSPDVTYSFSTTQTSYVIVSLDFPETNFDTRVYVLRDDGSNNGRGRSFGWRTDVNGSNNKSVLSYHTLPAGDYFIVVEGQNNIPSNWGDYKISVALPDTYEPGSITHPSMTIPFSCVLHSPIVSGDAPVTSIGDLEFQWEYKFATQSPWLDVQGATSESLTGDELGPIIEDSLFVRRRLKTLGGAAYTNELTFVTEVPGENGHNGSIGGKVTGVNGGDIAGVSIVVEALGSTTCSANTMTTAADGTYAANNLFYGIGGTQTFRVTPKFLDHVFDPEFIDVSINSGTAVTGKNFIDMTAILVEGEVTQEDSLGTICGLPDVIISTNEINIPSVTTQLDGSYALPISTGVYTIWPDFMDSAHVFSPTIYENILITTDTSGFNFESTTTHTVSGSVMACAGFCYGGVVIRLVDDYGCFNYTMETDQCGNFSATLPARNYQLIVTNNEVTGGLANGYDAQDIADFFANQDTVYADLSVADAMITLRYEQAPIVTLRSHTDTTGIQPIAGCSQDTVLAQGELTTLIFDIVETNTAGCPLDTGIMVLVDEISGADTVYVPISDGIATYNVIPDTPYLFPFEPYQHLEFYAMNIDSQLVSTSDTIRAIVTGLKARNSSFATVSPEIPFLILRDPPGDESYAYFEESHTTEFNLSFSAEYGGSVTTWGKAKTGAKFEAGFLGFSTESEAWGEVGASATVSARNASDRDLTVSITNSVEHSTDQDPDNRELIGDGGDLFVGAAMNIIFAKADVLIFDEEICQDTQIVELIMGQDSFATQFVYTAHYIRTVEIPKIEGLRDLGPPDSIWWYQNQVDMWEQTLARNEALKQIAVPSESYPSNISFSGGSDTKYTTENSTSTSIAYEFSLEVAAEFSAEVGFEVAGSGASGGVQSNFRVEIGGGSSSSELSSRVTQFTLSDSEPQDGYTVDIRECPVYNTPVFNLVSATTSCPYIPNTVQRDKPLILIDNPIRQDADPNGTETFFLEIYNLTESDFPDNRNYVLDFIDVTNANNATMNPDLRGTNKIELLNMPYNPPGSAPVTVRVDVNNLNGAFDYENMTFVVYPSCDDITSIDPSTSSRASISIFYESPCSEIEISSPTGDYNVNIADNNVLPVTLSGYTLGQLDDVEVQYTTSGGATWTTGLVVTDDQLDPGSTDVNLDVSDLSEGMYDLRLKLNCDGGASFTQRTTSLIDRVAPIVFGIPSPIDDNYDQFANDEISVSFEEDITCVNASVLLTNMETLIEYSATLGCSENKATVVPDSILADFDPAVYRVTLSNLEDKYGNVREDYRWVFVVGDYVYDPDCSPVNISNNNVNQDAISQSVYQATEITSDGTVAEATQVGYEAQESVSLEAGFSVNQAGLLEINIENCND